MGKWYIGSRFSLIVILFIMLVDINGSYMNWNYKDPELAVAGTILHGFEFMFARLAPIAFFEWKDNE